MERFVKKVLIFSSVLLFLSCKKRGDTHVSGRVLNPITGKGFASVEVVLLRNKLDGFASSEKIVAKTTTNEDGNFELHHFAWLFDNYIQVSSSIDGYRVGWYINGEQKSTKERVGKRKTKADYYVIPYGFLKIKITNVNCINSNDKIEVWRKHLDLESYFQNLPMKTLDGCNFYLDDSFRETLMGNIEFTWYVTKNGIQTVFKDTIFIDEKEEKYYEINY